MIKAVIFDYGGVLSPEGGAGSVRSAVATMLGIPRQEVNIVDLIRQFREGRITTEAFLASVRERHPNAKTPTTDMFMESSGLLSRNETLYAFAAQLYAHGIRVAIMSDIFPPTGEMLRSHGNYDGFDPVLLSYEEHMRKPMPAFYQRAIEKLGLAPQEILFIDDKDVNLIGAQHTGMQTLKSMTPDQTAADIRKLIKEQNNLDI